VRACTRRCSPTGAVGARRKADGLAAPDQKRGRKPTPASETELARLRKENAKLTKELAATWWLTFKKRLGTLGDRPRECRAGDNLVIDASVTELTPPVGTAAVCRALNASRSSVYRRRSPRPVKATLAERTAVLGELRSERFMDDSPAQVYATLLDEGTYLATQGTMYRLLAANGEVRERRDQLRRPNYAKRELLATKSNELWSWDITKLFGTQKLTIADRQSLQVVNGRCDDPLNPPVRRGVKWTVQVFWYLRILIPAAARNWARPVVRHPHRLVSAGPRPARR
jgi:hypothetical protein